MCEKQGLFLQMFLQCASKMCLLSIIPLRRNKINKMQHCKLDEIIISAHKIKSN